ncbi:MAG: mannose-1-phosphate guanylyltransferase [bacterium]|nr:mannose-1-phosphate guanylyltransferase [bacterium]MDE0289143.1 mannose-1-phosphate guanylyltransferase [bacterium]MDE0438117.1 mannose-1-phosphate guanylyltransferase [bacterium]
MLVPVILAGGLGTRLWPASRPEFPKPLLRLTGKRSLLQETVVRAAAIPGASPPVIVCGTTHYPPVTDQLDEIGRSIHIAILEPAGRSTAPAVAAAALVADEDDILFVMPADHMIDGMDAFLGAVRTAGDAARAGWLVTFGVTPDRPETGYGYIERGDAIEKYPGAFRIASFREKPDLATARRYVDGSLHWWNSGMFMFRAGAYLEELRDSHPDMVRLVDASLAGSTEQIGSLPDQGVYQLDPATFASCPAGSIDRAVMERTRRGAVVPLRARWNDVGSWAALWDTANKDGSGNVVTGPAHLQNVSSSYVTAGDRPVVVIGLANVVVVDAGEAVLVAGMDQAQQVKPLPETDQSGSVGPTTAERRPCRDPQPDGPPSI